MSHFRPYFVLLLPALGAAGIFDAPELKVAPSPTQARQIHLAAGIRVVDTDVSPAGPAVALLLQNASGAQEIQFWNLDQAQPAKVWDVPTGLTARSLAFHPLGDSLFLVATQSQQFVIVKVEKKSGAWTSHQIYTSRQEIRRLVPGPRPYAIGFDEARHENIQGLSRLLRFEGERWPLLDSFDHRRGQARLPGHRPQGGLHSIQGCG
jgi:hypothetical protein